MFGLMGVARMPGQPGGAFSPLSLFAASEQGVWYDPSDFSTMFQDSAGTTPVTAVGQPVGRINDKSGNGNHATLSTTATLAQDGDGAYYLQLSGAGYSLNTGNIDLTAVDKATIWIGFQVDSVASTNGLYDFNAGTPNGFFAYMSTNAILYSATGGTGTVTMQRLQTLAAATKYIFAHRCDLSQSTDYRAISGRVNSILGTTSTSSAGPTGGGNFANGALRAGKAIVTNLTGRLYAFVMVARDASAEIRDCEMYLNNKMTAYTAPTRTACVLGDSTISAYLAQNAVTDYITTAYTVVNQAVPGQTIGGQTTVWDASTTRGDPAWVVIQVGLNDLDPGEAASVAIARLQTLVNATVARCAESNLVFISQMTPCRARLIALYGAINGPVAYQKWLDMNDAIAGNGATPITGVRGRVTAHVALLNDGAGNLAAAYEIVGTVDGIHENNAGREIIADAWAAAIAAAGVAV